MHRREPQVAARGIVVQEQKILLVRGDGDGSYWVLPGGRCEFGEDCKSCAEREVFEETGFKVTAGPLFAVSEFVDDADNFHITQLIFFCRPDGSKALPENWQDFGGPVEESRFFSLAEVRQLEKVFPSWLCDGEWLSADIRESIYRGLSRK